MLGLLDNDWIAAAACPVVARCCQTNSRSNPKDFIGCKCWRAQNDQDPSPWEASFFPAKNVQILQKIREESSGVASLGDLWDILDLIRGDVHLLGDFVFLGRHKRFLHEPHVSAPRQAGVWLGGIGIFARAYFHVYGMNDRKAETQTTCTSTTGMSCFECFCCLSFACSAYRSSHATPLKAFRMPAMLSWIPHILMSETWWSSMEKNMYKQFVMFAVCPKSFSMWIFKAVDFMFRFVASSTSSRIRSESPQRWRYCCAEFRLLRSVGWKCCTAEDLGFESLRYIIHGISYSIYNIYIYVYI